MLPRTLAALDVMLADQGVDQQNASYIGIVQIAAGTAAGVLAGRWSGFTAQRLWPLILGFYAASTVGFGVFALLCAGALPFSEAAAYLSSAVGGLFINASLPLFYELAAEMVPFLADWVV